MNQSILDFSRGMTNNNRLATLIAIPIYWYFFLIVLITSCSQIKTNAVKSSKTYHEMFYVGTEGTQYFIKPIVLKNKSVNESIIVDFTFRYKNEIKDSAILNYSIKSESISKKIDSLIISNEKNYVKIYMNNLLFNEKQKSIFISRFSTKITVEDLKRLFENNNWEIICWKNNEKKVFKASRKTGGVINKINNTIFIVM